MRGGGGTEGVLAKEFISNLKQFYFQTNGLDFLCPKNALLFRQGAVCFVVGSLVTISVVTLKGAYLPWSWS